MRFLIDTNILLHAVNSASPFHRSAREFLQRHLRNRTAWCICWPILYEFLRVSTHWRVFPKPLTPVQALDFINGFVGLEEVAILSATDRHFAVLKTIVDEIGPTAAGNLFHDIHTATLIREHGVPEIVTADKDFLQFSFLRVSNPLQAQ
jgi:toxin-antitoxin system PIN domain toxin